MPEGGPEIRLTSVHYLLLSDPIIPLICRNLHFTRSGLLQGIMCENSISDSFFLLHASTRQFDGGLTKPL